MAKWARLWGFSAQHGAANLMTRRIQVEAPAGRDSIPVGLWVFLHRRALVDLGLSRLPGNCIGNVTGIFSNSVDDARLAGMQPRKTDEVQALNW